MTAYLMRRLLLVIPTLFGIMVINFALTQFVPGGPIEQIIANLLDNSVSFSDDNKKINILLNSDSDGYVKVNVIDEGRGFKELDTKKIFKRFYSNRPDKFGEHSGLGLNIVKNLVELHNGTIIAKNNKDKGANVEIIFPSADSKVD